MDKLISVIVPVHNAEDTIDSCMQSIVEGTYKNLEILLVQNGSKDNTLKKSQEWAEKDSRIKVIDLKDVASVSAARNAGIEQMTGEYFTFVDADDSIDKTMYQKLLAKALENDSDMVFCKVNSVFSDGKQQPQKEEFLQKFAQSMSPMYLFYRDNRYIRGAIWRVLYKTKTLKEIRFDTEVKYWEDRIYLCECLDKCKKCDVVDEELYNYTDFYNVTGYTAKKYNMGEIFELSCRRTAVCVKKFLPKYVDEQLVNAVLYDCYLAVAYEYARCRSDCRRAIADLNKDEFWREINTKQNRRFYKQYFKTLKCKVKYLLVNLKLYTTIKLLFKR